MLGWRKHKLESRLPGELSVTSDMQMTPPLWQKGRGTKETLDESKESEKAGLKLNMQKTRNITSGSTTSWKMDGDTRETVTDCIFLGYKITADSD